MKMKISIIIPCYNEEKTIEEVIKRVKQLKLSAKKEIIVVDDGSQDSSFKIMSRINGIKIIKHKKNKGKGAAIRRALEEVTGDIVLIQDADLELDPIQIPNLIKPIIEGKAEVVYGSRNLVKNNSKKTPLFYIGGRLITWITNLLYKTNLTDEPCGYKIFKAKIIKNIKIESDRFEWEPEITAKISKQGIKIYEVPVKANSRSIKEGKKLRRRDGVKALWTLLKYKFT